MSQKMDKMNNLKNYQKVSKERYNEANRIGSENTAYIRFGKKRVYYLIKKNIKELECIKKVITLIGTKFDVDNAIKRMEGRGIKIK